jgi:hypothetical protein
VFEITWWCVLVSAVLGAGVGLDARRRPPVWRLPAAAWVVLVVVTWVAVVLYVVGRLLQPASPSPSSASVR